MRKAKPTIFGAISIADVLAELDFRLSDISRKMADAVITGEPEDELRKLAVKHETLAEFRQVIMEEANTQKQPTDGIR